MTSDPAPKPINSSYSRQRKSPAYAALENTENLDHKQKDTTMKLTPIATHHNKEALLSFILAAQAGRLASATEEQSTAFRLASLIQELECDLVSLTAPVIDGFLALARLSSGLPVWDDQKIRAAMLIAAAVNTPDETNPEYLETTPGLPLWKRVQNNKKKLAAHIAQLVDEICDPALETIGGEQRKDFYKSRR